MLPERASELDATRDVPDVTAAYSDVVEREVSKVDRIELPVAAERLEAPPLTTGVADNDMLSERELELGVTSDVRDVTAASPDAVEREVSKVDRVELSNPAEALEVPPTICDAGGDEMLSEKKPEVGAARDDPEVVSPLLDTVEKEVSNVEEIEGPGTAETLASPIGDDVGLDALRESELDACVLTTMLESPAMPGVLKLLLDVWPDALAEKLDELTGFGLPTVARVLKPLRMSEAVALLLGVPRETDEVVSGLRGLELSVTGGALLIVPPAEKDVEYEALIDREVSVPPTTGKPPKEDDVERSEVSVPVRMLEPPLTPKVVPLLLEASGSGVVTDAEIGICVSDVLGACSLVVDADNKEGLCSIEPEVCGLIGTLTNVAPLLDADKVDIFIDVRLEAIVTSCGIKVELEPANRVSTVEKETLPVSAVEIDVLVNVRLEITVTS
ncbi:hypothetical protein LTR27_000586 [Elasticomyces elasticus]|nr:hypothetical protein LTR27_000586 [Elasticomyces elasticus]